MLDDWYRRIEDPLKEVVRALRNHGINTFCSCGHRGYIQCETYSLDDDLHTIFSVLVTLNIKKYRVEAMVNYNLISYKKVLEIQIADEAGEYYQVFSYNKKFKSLK